MRSPLTEAEHVHDVDEEEGSGEHYGCPGCFPCHCCPICVPSPCWEGYNCPAYCEDEEAHRALLLCPTCKGRSNIPQQLHPDGTTKTWLRCADCGGKGWKEPPNLEQLRAEVLSRRAGATRSESEPPPDRGATD